LKKDERELIKAEGCKMYKYSKDRKLRMPAISSLNRETNKHK
jgi:hypothetical protein